MSFLEVENVTKSYLVGTFLQKKSKIEAVSDVSLSLSIGECLGLVGESGSGKSTLGRMILGVERPNSGCITVNGTKLYGTKKIPPVIRRELQVVFQDCYGAVNPRMTAKQIIAEPLRNFQKLTKLEEQVRVYELLSMVGLQVEDGEKRPSEFSGGQLQRINIARAIALKPRLIVLDESISALDAIIQVEILHLLKQLKEQLHLSYIFISHDLQAVSYLADRIAVMHKGKIIEQATRAEELTHPQSKKLLEARLPTRL
jgi:nickel transport system ATP-binding protein